MRRLRWRLSRFTGQRRRSACTSGPLCLGPLPGAEIPCGVGGNASNAPRHQSRRTRRSCSRSRLTVSVEAAPNASAVPRRVPSRLVGLNAGEADERYHTDASPPQPESAMSRGDKGTVARSPPKQIRRPLLGSSRGSQTSQTSDTGHAESQSSMAASYRVAITEAVAQTWVWVGLSSGRFKTICWSLRWR